MAALGLLLLLLAPVVAPEPQQHVVQESVAWHDPDVKQVLQEELDPQVPLDVLVAVTGAVSPHRGSVLHGFPPAWPVEATVTRHCQQPPRPPPTPQLPPTSFSHLRRQAAALDAFRPRLDACCHHEAPVSCARHAWTEVLDAFCADEFGVKTRQFHCCWRRDAARRHCFIQSASAEASAGHEAEAITAGDATVELFPPGEPTEANMENICRLRALRPGPSGRSGPRVRMRLRLERDYGRCCRNGSLPCAHSAWQKGLDRFCREEAAVKTRQHRCCLHGGLRSRSRCFAAVAPFPDYDRELHNVSLVRPGSGLLRSLCGPTRLLSKRRPVPELLGAVTAACCSLPPENQSACAQEQLSQGITTLCASSWRDPHGCCSHEDPERRRCFDASYLDKVTLGAAVPPPPPGHDE
ncbi:LOW QUALITY PROTEIN: extracellular matrix protein 1 [Phaenicophaeus curvirostris]|uniref:LOW QUALITY PROTEIN: extracellular matrix protein 1 n=1 Tax=Phaenicophaeus curvirostris TaxID=33595 RepID=UPI0037F0DB5A